jgi:hypothetical protein
MLLKITKTHSRFFMEELSGGLIELLEIK